jgi:hypothetical protein
MSNILPQMLDMVPKKGPLDLSHRLDQPEFVRRGEKSYAVGTIFLKQKKPHRAVA